MSTIPFTVIEGAMALPRLRPLGQVPAPFGRDWALLPPGYSLRTEIKALYAALLRTFCMSDQAIRSLCKWAPPDERRAAAQASTAATAAVFDALPVRVPHSVAEAAAVAPIDKAPYGVASREPGNHWSALAGGACALSGAAVLAWIALGHLTHRHAVTHANFAGTVSTPRDSQSANVHPPALATARAVANGAAGASATVAASVPTRPRAVPGFAPASSATAASVSATPSASAQAHVSIDRTASHRRELLREKARLQHERSHLRNARFAAANQPSHTTAIANDVQHIAAPSVAANVPPRLSAAGPYSPLAPARLGVDEYADVAMSAATHLRDIAPRRPASSNNPAGTGGTEWMNHLSQRRVTEVPDQFAK